MTIDEAKKMAEAKLKCMERDVSGKDDDCNNHRCNECPLNYEQGNMGEQKEWLRMAIKALEQIIKIADIVDGTIDHFDRDDAMDMLYEIKGVIK